MRRAFLFCIAAVALLIGGFVPQLALGDTTSPTLQVINLGVQAQKDGSVLYRVCVTSNLPLVQGDVNLAPQGIGASLGLALSEDGFTCGLPNTYQLSGTMTFAPSSQVTIYQLQNVCVVNAESVKCLGRNDPLTGFGTTVYPSCSIDFTVDTTGKAVSPTLLRPCIGGQGSLTSTATVPPTVTPTQTAVACSQPSAMATSADTATSTAPAATDTTVPGATSTSTPAATDTAVPGATNTNVPTATNSPIPTSTGTPTRTPTNSPSPTVTRTSTPFPTPIPLFSPTPRPHAIVAHALRMMDETMATATDQPVAPVCTATDTATTAPTQPPAATATATSVVAPTPTSTPIALTGPSSPTYPATTQNTLSLTTGVVLSTSGTAAATATAVATAPAAATATVAPTQHVAGIAAPAPLLSVALSSRLVRPGDILLVTVRYVRGATIKVSLGVPSRRLVLSGRANGQGVLRLRVHVPSVTLHGGKGVASLTVAAAAGTHRATFAAHVGLSYLILSARLTAIRACAQAYLLRVAYFPNARVQLVVSLANRRPYRLTVGADRHGMISRTVSVSYLALKPSTLIVSVVATGRHGRAAHTARALVHVSIPAACRGV